MFYFALFVLLLSTSTVVVDGLNCATNCDFTTQIDNIILPSCTFVDRPSSEQSCQANLVVDYVSGSIVGRLNPRTPPLSFNYDVATVFSLSDETSNVKFEFDCSTEDKCDETFLHRALRADWIQTQKEVLTLRKTLADLLFNSSDLRPNDTCPANQQCQGEGFCMVGFELWGDGKPPAFSSSCANSTEKPLLEWVQAISSSQAGDIMLYTCNQPLCAASTTILNVVLIISGGYILPFNVTIPVTTTTTQSPLTSRTTPSMSTTTLTSSMATSTKNNAKSIHLSETEKMIFAFISLFFLCRF